ncbi:MAG: transposase [Oscillospiraceae bacterium]|nr:transposase [Oscillospiraceae bacterium]
MPNKSRLPLEEKIKAVEECLKNGMSVSGCARKYGVRFNTLTTWIRLYKVRGIEGLIPVSKQRKYSVELKHSAVQDFLSNAGSAVDICQKYDISSRTSLAEWVACYNGREDFKEPKSGGAIYVVKGRKTTLRERFEIVSHCIAVNKDYGKTIEHYGISYPQIYGWVRKHEKDGLDGLIDRRGKRKGEDSMTEMEKLRAQLKLKEAENLRLQMENELLKKLEALERGLDVD